MSGSLLTLSTFQRTLLPPLHTVMTEAESFSQKSIKFYKFIPEQTGYTTPLGMWLLYGDSLTAGNAEYYVTLHISRTGAHTHKRA